MAGGTPLRYTSRNVLIAIFAFVLAARADRPRLHNALDLRIAPRVVLSSYNGGEALVYELHITNCSRVDLTLDQLELLEVQTGKLRLKADGAALARIIGRWDNAAADRKTTLSPGIQVVLYLTVPSSGNDELGRSFVHRITYRANDNPPLTAAVQGGDFTVSDELPIVLGPPLGGSGWTAIYNDEWESGHRRAIYTTSGLLHIPGRFAIDWVKVAPNGTHAKGAESEPANWYGYGAEVLAVADGEVTMAMDDIPDPPKVDPRAVSEIQNASGNYVVLRLGNSKYVFYEHLRSKSIRVRTGDHIRRGQVLAQLGYTGQSTGPHLHFHVADSAAPLNAEGVPYVFEEFKTLGSFSSAEQFGRSEPWNQLQANKHRQLPAPFSVVEFP
jgi:hypothetical protein